MPAFDNLPKCIAQEHIIKYDYMVKRSLRRRARVDNYKSRWFILCPQALYYCEGSLETGPGKMKGGIVLSNIIAVENTEPEYIGGKTSVFQIVYRPETDVDDETVVLYIKASHDDQRKSWLEEVRSTCLDTGFCTPVEHFHPASFQSGRYPCCDTIDRRSSGCQETSWLSSVIPSTMTETSPTPAARTSRELEKNPDARPQLPLRQISEKKTPLPIPGETKLLDKSRPKSDPTTPPVPKPRSKLKILLALYDFNPEAPGDLSLKRGDEYEVLNEDDLNWWKVRSRTDGSVGCVPSTYLISVGEKQKTREEVLVKYNWYFGALDRAKAEELLMKEGLEGTFLIRDSPLTEQPFTLSVFSNSPNNRGSGQGTRNVVHYRIKRDNEGKYLITHACSCLADLVVFHKKNSSGLVTKLISPPVKSFENAHDDSGYNSIMPPPYARPNHKPTDRQNKSK